MSQLSENFTKLIAERELYTSLESFENGSLLRGSCSSVPGVRLKITLTLRH